MKQLFFFVSVIVGIALYSSCETLSTCEEIEKSEVLMLIDISDKALFSEINTDLTNNFSEFMKQSELANIQECQSLKISIGNLSGKDELKIKSSSIGITKKGLSKHEKRKRAEPIGIVKLLKSTLAEYDTMSRDVKYNSATNILQTTVKSILGFDEEAENTLLIFSDMVINNKIENVNFYRSIPKNTKSTITKLIDPVLREQLRNKIETGLDLKIIIVLKDEPKTKVKKKNVKVFWHNCFKELGLEDVQFIDNLSNKIQWD